MRTPAQRLLGKKLPNGWIIEEAIKRPYHATGGCFSCSYLVRSKDGVKAFLKAMDFVEALKSDDPALTLEAMTTAYNFERDLLKKCKAKRFSKVVNLLDDGKINVDDGDPSSTVQYLIFELAQGDIRTTNNFDSWFETAFSLRVIHNTAVGLWQLHREQIAHQDVKPSNILMFDESDSKLADLGRAFSSGNGSPNDDLHIAGDPGYAPPELLYEYIPSNWVMRRLGCDMYLLGSIIVFFCTGTSMTPLLFANLDNSFRYENWNNSYDEVLPYLQNAFLDVIRNLRERIQPQYSIKIAESVKQLCDPDPRRRGHPKNIISKYDQYSLERYVSIFGNLASSAELSLIRKAPISK